MEETPDYIHTKLDQLDPLESSDAPSEKEGKANKVVQLLDSYAVEEREPNFVGMVVSLCILPATIIYAVMLYLQLQDNPFVESNQIIWSMAFNPFPVDFECLAESGCILSGTEQNGTRHAGCVTMASHERKTFYLNYAGGQMPMISLYTLNGSAEVAVVWSQANHWEGDPPINKNGVKDMAAKLFGATLSANYVKVFNRTLAGVGSVRHEWFFTYMSSDGTHEPFDSDPCVDVVNARGGVAQMQHTKVRMAPFYNEIEVKDSFGVLEYIGTTSGMYGLFISGGALVLALLELDFCTRRLGQIFKQKRKTMQQKGAP